MKAVTPTTTAAFLCAVLLTTSVAHGARRGRADEDDEGSGDADYTDDEDLVAPSPSLSSSPVAAISPTRVSAPPTSPMQTTRRPDGGKADIYLEEGSGYPPDGVRSTPRPSPTRTPYVPAAGRPGATPPPAIVTTRIANRRPQLQKKLRKLAVTAGRYRSWQIPADTFFDAEDGNTRRLRLTLRYENGSVLSHHNGQWVKFDMKNQVVHLLPVNENDIGRWRFRVNAMDSKGQSAEDFLEIFVRQFSGSRLINNEFDIEFSFVKWKPAVVRSWEWMVMDRVRKYFGDPNFDNIIVRRLTRNPFVFGWTNSSLIQHSCPRAQIEELYHALTEPDPSGGDRVPSQRLRKLLGEDILVKSVRLKHFGACLEEVTRHDVVTSQNSGTSDNSVPVIRNPIDLIKVTAGELLRFKVPEDTCYDSEDGSTDRLSLQLLTMSRKELSPHSWLKFDSRNQEFYGVPLEEEVGREEYQLVCSDHNGLSVIDGIEVVVLNRPFSERFGVEFNMEFDTPVESQRVALVELLSSYFGDGSNSNVVLKLVDDRFVVWRNKSFAYAGCNDPGIEWMRRQLRPEGRELSPDLVRHFERLGLRDAEVSFRGNCIVTTPFPTTTSDEESRGNNLFHGIIPSVDYLMTFLVPAIIITLMLLLAIMLALVLHRKRKAGKLNLFYSEALPPRVPVILQDELVDPSDPSGAFQKRTTVVAAAPADPHEFDRLVPKNNGMAMEMSSPRPTPAYHYRQT